MNEIPHRFSLVSQVAEILRRGIERGEWGQHLPGERVFRERLRVGRNTLRAALDCLQREGLIAVAQGQRRRILRPSGRVTRPPSAKVVGVLAGLPHHLLSPFSLFCIGQLQGELYDLGYRLEVHANPRFGDRHPARALANLMQTTRADAWVLIGPPDSVVKWFSKHRLPVIIAGANVQRYELPCLDVDFNVIARHAVGNFLRRGHARIALLAHAETNPATASLTDAFRNGFRISRRKEDARPIMLPCVDSVNSIVAALEAAFTSPDCPTGILVARPKHVLTVMSHLAARRMRVPQDVSLISMGHFPMLDNLTPSVAHYTFDWKAYAQRLCALTKQLLREGRLPSRQHWVMPRFVNGGTLAPLRPAPP